MAYMYPDLKRCHEPSDVPPYAKDLHCCPPYHGEIPKKFEFPTDLPMRTRLAAHNVDDDYVAKYAKAVCLMKKLDREDPRNFMQQANVHCAYCNSAYYMGETEKPFKVHGGWFFLPWHRWYLYFYERILAKLLKDDTFALPFWNWDLEGGMTIPDMYNSSKLSLYNKNRNVDHVNAFVDLGYHLKEGYKAGLSDGDLIHKNYRLMHKQIVVLGSSTRCFHGEAIRENSLKCTCGSGTLEYAPHNPVHDWTGSLKPLQEKQDSCPSQTCYGEDMGIFYSAARDPMFFAHHGNVDRIWTIWKTQLGGKDYDDTDLLDTRFYFYDENAELVEVRAGDAFDTEKLFYQYEYSPTPWIGVGPFPAADLMLSPFDVPKLDLQTKSFSVPVKIDVARTPPSPAIYAAFNELLVIDGIRVQRNIAVKFDVFVQLDDRRVATAYVDMVPPEYVGTFVELRRGAIDDEEAGCGQSSMHVVISKVLSDLGVDFDLHNLAVTIIPKVNLQQPIQISDVRIEYDPID